jgi:hypothetical protein
MATSLTISSSSYAGELALPYIQAAILSGDTLANGYIAIKENVKYKAVIKKLSSSGLVVAATCDFTVAGSVTLAETVLTTTDLNTNVELCKKQFVQDWEAYNTGAGFINDQVPVEFADFMLAHIAAKVGEAIEFNLWQGNFDAASSNSTPTYSAFTGLLRLIDNAKSGTPDVDFSAATSASNVIAQMQSVLAALPSTLIGKTDTVKLYVNRKTAQFYRQAINTLGYQFTYNATGEAPVLVDGYEIYVCPGIPDATMVAAEADNLFFGTDLLSDLNEAKVIDMSMTDGSDNVRIAMRYRAGTAIGFGADISLGYVNP